MDYAFRQRPEANYTTEGIVRHAQRTPSGIGFVGVDTDNWVLNRDAILEIEQRTFPPSIQDDSRHFEELLRAPAAILIAATSIGSRATVGYIAGAALEAFPHIPGVQDDTSFGQGDTVYVESVAVLPAWRNRGVATALFEELLNRAREHQINRLTAHVETGRASYFGHSVATLAIFPDWYATGKSFQYVEFRVEGL